MLLLNPTYLWALAAVPVAVLLFLWAAWQRKKTVSRFGDTELVSKLMGDVSTRRRRWKAAVLVLSILCIAAALPGPRFGTKLQEATREGVDLVIALDVSQSMLAEDVAPNRLLRAKNEIEKVLDQLRGDRVGLVLFSGDAFIQCPLTSDYSAVRLFLDVADPTMIPTPGTNFGAAVRLATEAFESIDEAPASDERTRVLLIVSDGENHVGDAEEIVQRARADGLTVFTAGVGELEGAPIPIVVNGLTTYKRDNLTGQVVNTRLEEGALRTLASDGAYFRIGRTSSSLPEMIAALDRLERTEFDTEQFEEYQEQYQWPLALGLLLLVLERVMSEHRRRVPVEPVA
jgi:Ca-activated chloride channel homolog